MKLLFLICSFFVSNSSYALFSPCESSYHWDSYGRGLKSAFYPDRNFRARFNDESCYIMGANDGLALLENQEHTSCLRSFSKGINQGVAYQSMNNAADNCFVKGHIAGVADLDIAAREGNSQIAGRECVKAYTEGRKDYQNNMANDSSSIDSAKAKYCYGLGWYEAPLF